MGQGESTPQTDRDRRNAEHLKKGPVDVHVQQPSSAEKKQIMKIPGTNVRVLHVDPRQRGEVVPEHGYVALEYIPSWRRGTSLSMDQAVAGYKRQRGSQEALESSFGRDIDSDDEAQEQRKHRPRREAGADEFEDDAEPPMVPQTGRKDDQEENPFADDGARQETVQGFAETKAPGEATAAVGEQEEYGAVEKTFPDHTAVDLGNLDEAQSEGTSSRGSAPSPPGKQPQKRQSVSFAASPKRSPAQAASGFTPSAPTSMVSVDRHYVKPTGTAVTDRVFFQDVKRPSDFEFNPSLHSKVYELEEDEIHEIAGVQRISERARTKAEQQQVDPFATYEVHSDVLAALEMAIEAPMKEFRLEEVAGEEDQSSLKEFRKEAMEKAQNLFEEAQEEFSKTSRLGVTMGTLRPSSFTLGRTVSRGSSRGLLSTPEGEEMKPATPEDEAKMRKQRIKRRKQLHKQVNAWKAEYETAHGQPPTQIELSNDPAIRDVYLEYVMLKKETTSKAEEELAATTVASPVEEAAYVPEAAPAPEEEIAPPELEGPRVHLIGEEEGVPSAKAEEKEIAAEVSPEAKPEEEEGEEEKPAPAYLAPLPVVSPGEETPKPAGLTPRAEALIGMGGLAVPFDGVRGVEAPFDGVRGVSEAPSEVEPSPEKAEAAAATALSKEQKKELKTLAKQVKAWKVAFKKEHDRNPTRREISHDPEIADAYLRQKELKAIEEGEAPAGEEGEEGAAATTYGGTVADLVASLADVQLAGEFLEKGQALEAEEHVERRNAAADEEFDRKAIMRRAAAVLPPPPVRAEPEAEAAVQEVVEAADLTSPGKEASAIYAAEVAAAERSSFVKPAPKQMGGWGGVSEVSPKETLRRRASIVGALKGWHTHYSEEYGTEPTLKDLRDDSKCYGLYQELQTLPNPDNQGETFEIGHALGGDDPRVLARRRKELGKQLNAWKAQYAADHGKEPTAKDIKADPDIAGVYEEYSKIPKDIAKQAAAFAAAEDGGQSFLVPKSRGDGLGGTFTMRQGTSMLGETMSGASDAKRRKKQLGRELNAWKAHFAEENGREPTAKDIKASEIANLFDEYRELGKQISEGTGGGLEGTVVQPEQPKQSRTSFIIQPTAGAAEGAGEEPALPVHRVPSGVNPKVLLRRRKALGRELNAWKGKFAEENGRQPTTKDMKGDESISAIYAEYQAIPKDGGASAAAAGQDLNATMFNLAATRPTEGVEEQPPAQEGAAPKEELPPASISAEGTAAFAAEQQKERIASAGGENPQLKLLKKRKKTVGKELNAWKADFQEATGRKAKTSDIKADGQIGPLYEEYQNITKEIETLEAGGIVGADATLGGTQAQFGLSMTAASASPERETTEGPGEGTTTSLGDTTMMNTTAMSAEGTTYLSTSPGQGGAEESSLLSTTSAGEDDPKRLAKRRKELGKQLNNWKTNFSEQKGRAPTNKDIKRDPEAAALFDEYQRLKEKKEDSSKLASPEPEHETSTQHSPEAEVTNGGVAGEQHGADGEDHAADDGGEARPGSAGEHETQQKLSPAERKARKKQLNKELNTWKEQFLAENGHNPKSSDIQLVPEVFDLYQQLQQLKESS